MTLAFQKQLLDEHKPICETDAGKILFHGFKERNPDLEIAIETTQSQMLERIAAARTDNARLSKVATNNMPSSLEPARDELRRFVQKSPDIRMEWENRTKKDREALEKELRHSQDLLESRNRALADVRRLGSRPPALEVVYRDEIFEPKRQRRRGEEVVRWKETRKPDNQYASHRAASAGLGIVGTGLAVGQLVAAIACTVM